MKRNLFALGALSLLLLSCEGNTTPAPPAFEDLGHFAYSLRDSQDSLQVCLSGIHSPVSRIESAISWLGITDRGTDSEGNVQLFILRHKPTPTHFVADSAFIYFEENRRLTLVITADEAVMPPSGNAKGEYDSFNKAWWEQEEILYSGTRTLNGVKETYSDHIPLPWAPATTSNIPTALFIQDDMSSTGGWVMAYNLFAAETNGNLNSKPYFMLYNLFTGTLRTFYYQFAQSGTGGEFSVVVTPDDAQSPKFPYYHSLQYGFPVGNTAIPSMGNALRITKGQSSFQQMITPYLKADVALKPGWYCFDMDWSAYAPASPAPFQTFDRISIDCMTANNARITLAGVLNGDLEGTTESLTNTSTYSSTGSGLVSSLEKAGSAIEKFLSGDYLNALCLGIGTTYKLRSTIKGNPAYTSESKSTGTITMNFTGKIDLSGYITSNTSNNAIGLEFSPTSFAQSPLVGQGIWSLQDNPVVYVVNDRLLGEDEDFACQVTAEGYSVGAEDPAPNNLRLVTFFDPTTLKFNLNTALFKDLRNVKMCWMLGVYPNQKHGHTDPYRIGLLDYSRRNLLDAPEFVSKNAHAGQVYKSFSSTFANMAYLECPLAQEPTTRLVSTTRPKIFNQAGARYRYYGQAGCELPESDPDFFVVDPVVFLPTEFKKNNPSDPYGVGMVYDFAVPDFVLCVTLTFNHTLADGTEATAMFSQRFLPCVKGISTQTMLHRRTALQSYVQGGTHQKLGDLTIRHEGAAPLLDRFFRVAEFLEDYDE